MVVRSHLISNIALSQLLLLHLQLKGLLCYLYAYNDNTRYSNVIKIDILFLCLQNHKITKSTSLTFI